MQIPYLALVPKANLHKSISTGAVPNAKSKLGTVAPPKPLGLGIATGEGETV
jgi:hypothetical protein